MASSTESVRYQASFPGPDGTGRSLRVVEETQIEEDSLPTRRRVVMLLSGTDSSELSAEGEIERAFTITEEGDGHFRATDQGSEAFFWNGSSEGLQPNMGLQQLLDSMTSSEDGNVPLEAASKAIETIRQVLREWEGAV